MASELPRQQWKHLRRARHEVLEGTEARPQLVARYGMETTLWQRLPGQRQGADAWFELVNVSQSEE